MICNATRGIEAGRAVIRHRGVYDGSDGACPLRRSHSTRTGIFFADVLVPGTPRVTSSSTACYFAALFSCYSVKLHSIFTLIFFCLHSPSSLHPTWNLQPARSGITIHRRIKKPTLREHLHMHCRRQPIFIADQRLELLTQPSSIVWEIANVRPITLMMPHGNDTDRDITDTQTEDIGKSTLPSDIEEDDLDNLQKVVHPHKARCDKTIRTTRVPQPKKRSGADTVISRTSLPNL